MKNGVLKYLQIKNSTDTSADLYFYGDIVSDWWGAWQEEDQYPDAIKNFLLEQKGKDLNIYINSGGGSVFAGIAIYNMIKRHDGKVKVYVDGLAGSIASVIAFAGSEKPTIPANAFLMIHNPWTYGEGNAVQFRKLADDLDQIATGILSVYEEHLKEGVSISAVKALMEAETWLNGQQAAEYFDIEVGEVKEYAAAIGNYTNKCKNIPKDLIATDPEQKKPDNSAKDIENAEKRNKIKSLYLKGITEGE